MKVSRLANSRAIVLLTGVIITLSITGEQSFAAEEQKAALSAEEELIVERVKEALLKEFENGDFIQKQVEIGIQNYVLKQQQAKAESQAQKRQKADDLAKNVRPVSAERDHISGDPDAEVSLVEYSDFECPYCKRFHETPKKLVETFKGKVNWVYRHLPLSFHNPGAQKQAEASECAGELGGNNVFWKYSDAIYSRTKSNGQGFPIANLTPLAVELGLEESEFETCLESERHAARVKEDANEAATLGITGTPASILVNNRTGEAVARVGAQPFETLQADIQKLLKVQ